LCGFVRFSVEATFEVMKKRNIPVKVLTLVLTLMMLFGILACQKKDAAQTPAGPTVARGKTVYQSYCIACHNTDPKKPGTLGPDVFGSSKELLEARILRAAYPDGYKPKRDTKTMPATPNMKDDIPSLYLYLNEGN
jgi:mono/diheme cytochrome c family protein